MSGALLVLSFPKTGWHALAWLACVPLLLAIISDMSDPAPGRGFLYGYLCGAVFFAGSCYWFVGVMEGHGNLSRPLAVGVLVLFVIIFSFFFAFYGLVLAWTARRSQTLALIVSPFLWVSMELARTHLITGFPWNLLGYAVRPAGLRQLASITAVYGLSFLASVTSAWFAGVILRPRDGRRIAGLVFWMASLALANWLAPPPDLPEPENVVVLVQPDIPLGESSRQWFPKNDPSPLNHLIEMTLEPLQAVQPAGRVEGAHSSPPPLLVWSENPAPFYFDRDPLFRSAVERMARQAKAYAIISTVTFGGGDNSQPKNSAVVLDPNGEFVFQYDKIHLVPFGEYVPGWAFPGRLGKLVTEVGDFLPGSSYRAAQTSEGSASILICYEAIFPELVRRLVSNGPGVLVNISDDAWYGESSGPYQHLEMARLRAIENGRYLLRATNDGITAVVDPYGRVAEYLPRHGRRVLRGRFSYLSRRTFYSAHGDVFAWSSAAMTGVLLAVAGARKRRTRA